VTITKEIGTRDLRVTATL